MIVFLKKSSVILLACILVLGCCSGIMLFHSVEVPASINASFEKKIVLDAGHGEPDGGCVGADGTREADLNLAVAQKLQNLFGSAGIESIMTRTGSEGIFDASSKSIGEKKRSDMRKRREIQAGSQADIFVSIHMNQFEQKKYHGAQVVYDKSNPQAKRLAEAIQTSLRDNVEPENDRQAMAADSGIYLLKNAAIPSVIVECGFLSNPEELEKLKSDDYQSKLAWAIYMGIEQYFNNFNADT